MILWRVKPALLVALIAAAVATGYWRGNTDCEARHDAAEIKRIQAEREAEAERIRLQRERDEFARQLEEEINESPVVVNRCLGPKRGMQLNRLR